jgi:5-methylcytosine-specific restriction endonuclease McrA
MATQRRRRRPAPYRGGVHEQETSVPTGRAAYADTRRWLLDSLGPVCAYCGRKFTARTLTLDHVTPRRGQSAYDRRDNLVLACKACNTAKADKSFLAWVLGHKTRARHLFMYGQHLSAGILDILRPMAGNAIALPPAPAPAPVKRRKSRHVFGPDEHFGVSPYRDEPSPYADESPKPEPARGSRRRRGGTKKN